MRLFSFIAVMVTALCLSQALALNNAPPPGKAAAASSSSSRIIEQVQHVKVQTGNTARGLIGQEVFTPEEEAAGRVHDIILDVNGKAHLIILSDGGFFGRSGKLVALDYQALVSPDPETGTLGLNHITGDLLEISAPFNYTYRNDGRIAIIPTGGISIERLLEGRLLGADGEPVADINNVTFDYDQAEYIVVSVNELLDMGDQKAVIRFDALMFQPDEDALHVRLSGSQTARFESFLEDARSRL